MVYHKWKHRAVALVAALICATVLFLPTHGKTTHEDADQQVVAVVNGDTVTMDQVLKASVPREKTATMFAQGSAVNSFDIRVAALHDLIRETVLLQQAQSRGIQVTEEQVAAQVAQRMEILQTQVLQSYPALSGKELAELTQRLMKMWDITPEDMAQAALERLTLAALQQQVTAEAPIVTQQDVSATYDALLSQQQAEFDGHPEAMESALLQGQIVVWLPYGVKVIGKLTFQMEQVARTTINTFRSLGDDAAADEVAAAQALALTQQAAWAETLLIQGLTMDQVGAHMNADNLHTQVNYFTGLSHRFGAETAQAADALEHPGDISQPFQTREGVSLVMLMDVLPPRQPVPLETVADELIAKLTVESQQAHYDAQVEAWMEQADIQLNTEALR